MDREDRQERKVRNGAKNKYEQRTEKIQGTIRAG